MSKYEAVYFVGDNQAINRVRVDSSKTRNRGAFSDSLAALTGRQFFFLLQCNTLVYTFYVNLDVLSVIFTFCIPEKR